jgi:hypothetical protein
MAHPDSEERRPTAKSQSAFSPLPAATFVSLSLLSCFAPPVLFSSKSRLFLCLFRRHYHSLVAKVLPIGMNDGRRQTPDATPWEWLEWTPSPFPLALAILTGTASNESPGRQPIEPEAGIRCLFRCVEDKPARRCRNLGPR